MRLDKLLAHMGFGSRKDVKQLLKKKVVLVDDKVVTKGDSHVDPDAQSVQVHGETIQYQSAIYLMLHKPGGYITATKDDRHQTVFDLIDPMYLHAGDLAAVGRLDKDTEGLLLLTNDGQLNHRLTSPKHEVWKTYYAYVDGHVTETHIEAFQQGVVLDDGYRTKPAFLKIRKSGEVSEIELAITEGKFHQVKRMFEAIGMKVTYLKRLAVADLTLDPGLKPGESRELSEAEMTYLKNL